MRHLVLILVVAALAAGVCFLVCRGGSPDTPDATGPTPATDPGGGPGAPTIAASGTGLERGTSDRTVGAAAAPRTRLEVRVARAPGDLPLGDIEIRATATAGREYRAVAVTDRDGIAVFEVPAIAPDRTDPRHLCIAAAGGRTLQVELAPGTPRRVELRLTPRLFVEGRTVDADGRAVPQAEIVFLPHAEPADGQWLALRLGHSNADGAFRLPLFDDGYLGARHRAFAPSVMQSTLAMPRDPATGTATVRLALVSPRCSAEGVVLAADGTPAIGVELQLRAERPIGSQTALAAPPVRLHSDLRGRFTTSELPPGAVQYEARADDQSCARGAFTIGSDNANAVRIQLAESATVKGAVRAADGERPAATVETGSPGDLLWQRIACADDGSFALAGLPAGQSEVVVRELVSRDGSVARRRTARTFELAPGATVTWDPVLEARFGGRQLRGLVVDGRRRPLAGCAVLARQHEPARTVRVATAHDGRFAIPCEGDGMFDVFVYAPGRSFEGFPCVGHRDVDADRGTLFVEIDTDRRPASVHGVVRSKAGARLPAEGSCWHREHQQTVQFTAARDGTFRLQDIPPGTVVLFFSHPGFVAPAHQVELGSGDERDLGMIELERGSAVYGTITAADGTPAEGVELAIQTDSTRLVAESGAGRYRFESVPAGSHRLLVHGTEIAASSHDIEVTPGVDVVRDIEVAAGIERRIQVTNPFGRGGWVTLALREPGKPFTSMVGQALPDQGAVEFVAYMAPGTYEAIAWDDEGRQGRANVTFTAGAAAPISIELSVR